MHRIRVNGQEPLEIDLNSKGSFINGTNTPWQVEELGNQRFHILLGSRSISIEVMNHNREEKTFQLRVNGKSATVSVQDQYDILLNQLGFDQQASRKVASIKAPMPGMVLRIEVQEGQSVEKDQPLLVLEAMKMENVIKSPGQGIVKRIECKQGDAVEKGFVLISFE